MRQTKFNAENNSENLIHTIFFSILIFLCCADLFFAVRIHDYNIRFGQLFLFAAALPMLKELVFPSDQTKENVRNYLKIIKNWVPFILFYFIPATLSYSPAHSFTKLTWAVFNIGGAALVLLVTPQWNRLKNGFLAAITLVAIFIWVEFITLYCFGNFDWFTFLATHTQEATPWFHNLLGYAQQTGALNDIFFLFRPHAFYYEPSYAGCALTLAFPICVAVIYKNETLSWLSAVIPALILGAIFITTSRSAILGACFGILLLISLCFFLKQKELIKTTFKIISLTTGLFIIFSFFSGVREYESFALSIFDPSAVASRVNNEHSSEGWRVANTANSIKIWEQHPFFGRGVPPLSEDRGTTGLGQTAQSMWMEIWVETGIIGFLAFLFGFGKTIYDAVSKKNTLSLIILLTSALIPHFIISMNFTSTFPRLDYWLFFFFSIRMLLEDRK
jgi:O-antigen ligase